MSSEPAYDQNIPYPQVFIVDRGGHSNQYGTPPNLLPCWSFPPPHETERRPLKRRGCMGVSSGLAFVVLLLFALVFASLGIGAVWIVNLQKELKGTGKMVKALNISRVENVINAPQKQIGLYKPLLKEEKKVKERPAAHVIGNFENNTGQKTLRWEPHKGRAFTAGGVVYEKEDGALQVNQTGLYYIYSKVELIFKNCQHTFSFEHSVSVRRHDRDSILMETHRQNFCPLTLTPAWTTDSFLGSALHLEKDDKVFVKVSHPSLLSHVHHANFFGLYKI